MNYMLSVQDDYLYEESGLSAELKVPVAKNYFKGNLAEASSHITDEMIEAFTVCGTEDQICERVEEYRRSGLNLPILQPISMKNEDIENTIKAGSALISSSLESAMAA